MRNESFEKYFSNLKRKDNSIWQPIKKRGKPKTTSPHYANIQHLRDHGQKVTRKKAELFAEHLSEVFAPHNNDQDQGVEQDLATPVQSKECLRAFTLKEIRDEIKILDKKSTRSQPYYCQNAKRSTKIGTRKPNVYIQRHTTT